MIRQSAGRLIIALMLIGAGGLVAPKAADAGYPPTDLPSPLDLMETGLYWLQDLSGHGELRDPASLLSAMQDVAARQFDLAEMALRVGDIGYLRLDLLARSHYQNRLKDRLFAELAVQFGMYDSLPPRFRPLLPVASGPGRWLVGLWVARRHHPPQPLYFHLRYGPAGWRIVDVSLGGELFSEHLRGRF